MIQLDPDRAALIADRQVGVQPAVRDPEVIQMPQGLAGEVTELGVVALGLQLGDHHDRQHDPVLGKPAEGSRVRQQDAGVEDVSEPGAAGCAGRWGATAGGTACG